MSVDDLMKKGDDLISDSIKNVHRRRLGVVDVGFLSQSVGQLNTPPAVCMKQSETVARALEVMRKHHIGCVLLTGQDGKLSGIFSERDCMEKVFTTSLDREGAKVEEFMTRDPVTIDFTVSMAYGLSLMSMGGFRHLPVVDQDQIPVGVVSVKDIVNHITSTFIDDIMHFGEET